MHEELEMLFSAQIYKHRWYQRTNGRYIYGTICINTIAQRKSFLFNGVGCFNGITINPQGHLNLNNSVFKCILLDMFS